MKSNWKEPRTVESDETRNRAKEARRKIKERLRNRRLSGRVDDDGHRLREIPGAAYFVHRRAEPYEGEKRVCLCRCDRHDPLKERGRPIVVTPLQYVTALKVRELSPTLVEEHATFTVWHLPEAQWRKLRQALTYHLEVHNQKPVGEMRRPAKLAPKKAPAKPKPATNLLARVKGQKFSSFADLRNALK